MTVESRRNRHPIVISVVIDAEAAAVWIQIRCIERHVDWMHDAVAVRFLSDNTEGVGTRFECDTRIGPFTTTDVMEVTAWEPERRLGVIHTGVVEGVGEFTLCEVAEGRTELCWSEELRFPWFMGGSIGGFFARPIMRWIWKRNLAGLKAQIESGSALT